MHCPSCGQQQISSETKFCSRCGLPLSVVAEVVSYGGYLPQLAELNQKKTVMTRRNGMAFSLLWCLFFLFIMTPFFGILGVQKMAGATAVFGIFGALIILVASAMFLKKAPRSDGWQQGNPPMGQQIYGQANQGALPPQQSVPASSYTTPQAGNWRDTNDLQPRSVVEGTTKLLDKDEH